MTMPTMYLCRRPGVRLLRFGIEGALAAHYGRGILAWMKSPTFQWVIGGFIVLAVAGTVLSAISVIRSTRARGRQPSADGSTSGQTAGASEQREQRVE